MRIKPYRVCDICGKEYQKTHGAMKVKMLYDPKRYCDMYGDLRIMERMDICPKCSELMLEWIQARQDEPQTDYEKGLQQLREIMFDKEKTEQFLKECEAMGIKPDCPWK